MRNILKIGYRSFIQNLPRFRIICIAIVFAVAIMLVIIGLIGGVAKGIFTKGRLYFGGDIIIMAYDNDAHSLIKNKDLVLSSLFKMGNEYTITKRSIYYEGTTFIFNGKKANQRRLIGIDWVGEKDILKTLGLVEGSFPDIDDKDAVIISTVTAERLHLKIGDRIVISGKSQSLFVNTVTAVVSGIYEDNSFFGFSSYMHYSKVNQLKDIPLNTITEIGVFAEDEINSYQAAESIRQELVKVLNVGPLINSRFDRMNYLGQKNDGVTEYMVMTLASLLNQINDLLNALYLILGGVLFIFIIVVSIGISNTYSILITERISEIGTIRALGMTRLNVVRMFLIEVVCMGVTSSLIGIFIGILALKIVIGVLDWSWITISSMFLVDGKLDWAVTIIDVFNAVMVVFIASIIGVLKPAITAARLNPVEALRDAK